MKKLNLNFIVNSTIFLLFLPMVSTGFLLYLFPRRIGDITTLGLSRHEWGDIHLVISLLFLIFIGIHLVIHYNWEKAIAQRFLKIGTKPLVISTLILFALTFAIPYLITKDLPASKTRGNRSDGWDNIAELKGNGANRSDRWDNTTELKENEAYRSDRWDNTTELKGNGAGGGTGKRDGKRRDY
jgi:Domain of unknown function (DUF4405)